MQTKRRATLMLGAIALLLTASALHCLEVATPPPKAADDGSITETNETLEAGKATETLSDASSESAEDATAVPDSAFVPDGALETAIDATPPDADANDAAKDASLDGTGEFCPDPLYPPRTDGCPCAPANGYGDPNGWCTAAKLGRVCDYYAFCPPGANRYTCKLVYPMEKPPYHAWVGSTVPCEKDDAGGYILGEPSGGSGG